MVKQQRTRPTLIIMLWRGWWLGLLILSSLFHSNVGGESPSPPTFSLSPTVTASATELLVEWRIPEAQLVARADGTTEVLVPDTEHTARPGTPALPFLSVLVAVPPGALSTLHVLQIEETERRLPGPLALAPFPAGVQRDAAGRVIGGDFVPASAAESALNADAPVILEPVGVVRGVNLARLVFYPARPLGAYPQTRLRVTTHIRIVLTFAEPRAAAPATASPDALLAAVRAAVINPAQVQPEATIQASPLPLTSGAVWMVEVNAPGITAVTYTALAESGFPVDDVDPHRLRLTRAGEDIAAEWDGNANTSFEPGERLLFYAAPRFSRLTANDVVLLWEDNALGLRMATRSATPSGQPLGSVWVEATAETNQLYTPDCFCGTLPAGRDGDRWVWDDLKRPGPASAAYPLALPTVDAAQSATLTLWLLSYTDLPDISPDHRVAATLNGTFLGNVDWNGKQAITATLPIPPGLLRTANALTLTLPGLPGVAIEGAWLDAFAIHYARGNTPMEDAVSFTGEPAARTYTLALNTTAGLRAYDVTHPEHPLRLTGVVTDGNAITLSDPLTGGPHHTTVTTERGLRFPVAIRPAQAPQPTGGADYMMIAPAAFIPALDDLVAMRRAQGLTVAVETVQAIYDTYGDGRPDPAAIRAYLVHAYATWTPRPTYVLLVGAGNFDPRRYRSASPPTLIPPYLANVDPWAGETAADNRYVAVDGADTLPDMLIGRLPVHTLAETYTVVAKIVQYETQPFPGGWNAAVTLVADDADGAGDFAAMSDALATTYITAPFTAQRIYFTPPSTSVTTTQQAVLQAFNNGTLIIQYTGHSSWQQWAGERFLHLDDLAALHNDRRWPIVLEMTCFTGAFHRPEATLDAGLVTQRDGGAAATWGATGLGLSTGHSHLAAGFWQAVFSDTVNTVGEATLAGKLSLAATGQHSDLLDTFTLLGDPALRINRNIVPWANRTYLPLVMRR